MISIVIPILNESENIEKLLFHLIDNASLQNIQEIVVVDGGSTDGSQEIVENLDLKVRLIHSKKGRARQMNFGARIAKGEILYFLHADSFPPTHYDKYIIDKIKQNNQAGCFRLTFDNNHWWLRLASWLTQFSWRACRGGDQSQFITKALFEDIGGFDESFTIYEDNILINELYKRKQFVVINKKIKTSDRLYKRHGIWKLQYYFWVIYLKKWFGASAEDLHTYYKKNIA
ncbi:TIGR04283 family arsenosugar biosynthesis glycosyltransferase [Lacinutrix sp. Bg11-31]|uniref:TIGR04283 family arsenosugar biosynthesis glycosyltransferase n=1 Tax=Lacinutrix sp. Bg11-31 TaxID=2057808 RepID=UPI000C30E201|nr:TIGR04283 family arsenosugar biosynthesis glycosyltransferase [Lacinutrix sp. Bg11-31]AUC82503.1 glycosyl transferase family 2 [Lacinutrix sp. Bg11-31]